MTGKRTKYLTVRLTDTEYAAFATKARAAGLTVSNLARDHFDRVRVVSNPAAQQREQLALARIAVMLAVIAERSRTICDPMTALEIIACLASIESELRERRIGSDSVC